MALKTSVGGADSTSFETLDWIENYLEGVYGGVLSESWTQLTDVQKEFRIESAAQFIGWFPLRGWQAFRGQALAFPRSVQADPYSVPQVVKEAQALIAYCVVHQGLELTDGGTVDGDTNAVGRITSISLGALSLSLDAQSADNRNMLTRAAGSARAMIYAKLKPYLASVRGRRVRTAAELETYGTGLLTTTT